MVDCFTAEVRSKVMSAVKSGGNKSTEVGLIQIFKLNGLIGWRRHQNIKGHPDFIFRKNKVAVFADGCFWHGHDCRNTRPKSNAAYWKNKIARNQDRDRFVNNILRKNGWNVIRFWECEIMKNRCSRKIDRLLLLVKR